jgi:hypothetical protein
MTKALRATLLTTGIGAVVVNSYLSCSYVKYGNSAKAENTKVIE